MATIRKRGNKWQVQIRRQEANPITKSFLTNSAAKRWAIQTEALIEAGEYTHQQQTSYSFKDLLVRYRDEISPKKKGALEEQYGLNVIIRDQISLLKVNKLTSKQFAAYRDKRLKSICRIIKVFLDTNARLTIFFAFSNPFCQSSVSSIWEIYQKFA